MKSFFFKLIYLSLFLTLLAGQAQAVDLKLALPGTKKAAPSEHKTRLGYSQLRGFLMDFADRYMQMIGQAADTLQKQNTDPTARVAIQSIKLFPSSAAFSIAIDSNPQMALLNMTVLVHLQGSVWRETAPKRFGEKAAILLNVQKELENDIDAIALKVLTPKQLEDLKALVAEWRREHPDQRYVSYIRFSDFTDLRPRRHGSSQNLLSISGLLSTLQVVNLDETTRSFDQARMVAERTIYLSQRMPTLLRWHTEMLFYQLTKEVVLESRVIIWEWTKACLVIIGAIFLLMLLYKFISRRI